MKQNVIAKVPMVVHVLVPERAHEELTTASSLKDCQPGFHFQSKSHNQCKRRCEIRGEPSVRHRRFSRLLHPESIEFMEAR